MRHDPGPLNGVLLLLVDDEPDGRDALAVFLEHYGAIVFTADRAEEALRLLQTLRVDVIISDIAMPGKNGIEFLREARRLDRAHDQPTPAIAYTGFPNWHRDALAAGYQTYFVKPVDPASVVEEIARLLRGTVA